jgi:hypothetical protein
MKRTSAQLIDEEALSAALMAMPPPQREVMLLRYRDGLSYQEIAQVVARPIGTVAHAAPPRKKTTSGITHQERNMSDTMKNASNSAWDAIESEKKRDQFIRKVCKAAWIVTGVLACSSRSWSAFRSSSCARSARRRGESLDRRSRGSDAVRDLARDVECPDRHGDDDRDVREDAHRQSP